jgi:hypothetical protein
VNNMAHLDKGLVIFQRKLGIFQRLLVVAHLQVAARACTQAVAADGIFQGAVGSNSLECLHVGVSDSSEDSQPQPPQRTFVYATIAFSKAPIFSSFSPSAITRWYVGRSTAFGTASMFP